MCLLYFSKFEYLKANVEAMIYQFFNFCSPAIAYDFIMKSFAIFFIVAVAAASAHTIGKKCTSDKECYPRPPLGVRFYCDPDEHICYSKQITSPHPLDKYCSTDSECVPEHPLLGVRYYCEPASKTCYTRQIVAPTPQTRYCETRADCYGVPIGVQYYCDVKTETCASKPLVSYTLE